MRKLLLEIEHQQGSRILSAPEGARRILLVEDNESSIIQVKSALQGEGYILDVARDGREALDYIEHTIPDGIILDLMMPGVDGFEVLENIRRTGKTARIPVLILTAKDLTEEDLKRLTSNNIQQLIQKGDVDREGLLLKTKMMIGAEAKIMPKAQSTASERPTPKAKPAGRKKIKGLPTILIVEDNTDNMTTIKAVLDKRYNMLEATDGEEGLKKALSEKPDLVLLDISLPKMDGYRVVKKIREDNNICNVPVIGLTAHAMKGDEEKIIAAGCNNYISKPIDPAVMIKTIGKILEGANNAENISD